MEPLSPAAHSLFRNLFTNYGPRFLGLKVSPDAPPILTVAGGRLFIDFTFFARTRPGQALLSSGFADSAMGLAVRDLLDRNADRLPPLAGKGALPVWRIRKPVLLTVAGRALRALASPERTREQTWERLQAFVHRLEEESRQIRGVPEQVAFIHHVLSGLFRGQLMGVREWPKFFLVHVMDIVRQVLLAAGDELVRAGRLDRPEDVFFLHLEDLTADRDLRQLVAQNRAEYEREIRRRPVPMAITSEGEVSYGAPAHDGGTLVGTGSSAGVCEGVVRVILSPVGAHLEPGEVLVAPGTDPAWTPLFLTAGALVTETGGMMSHGSVVAREYGIPAVVGVPGATTRLRTGQRVRVDGSSGTVVLLP